MADANALVNALALSGSADPSDLIRNQLQAQQQQALAQALMTQGLTPMSGTESVGGVAIRRSPMEGAAKLAALLSGQSLQGQANDKSIQAALGQGQAMRAMFGLGDPAQAPQQAQQPQGGQPGMPAQQPTQGGPLSVAGASPMTNMLSYSTDPAAHMKSVMEQYAATPEMKQAAAAYGVGSPKYIEALQAVVAKAGYRPPVRMQPGGGVMGPDGKITTMPSAAPPGYQNTQDATGNWVTTPVSGGLGAVQGSTEAKGLGAAAAEPSVAFDENNNPIFSTKLQDLLRAKGWQPPATSGAVPPGVMPGANAEALKIMRAERATMTNPADIAATDREIARLESTGSPTGVVRPQQKPGVVAGANTAAEKAQSDLDTRFAGLRSTVAGAQTTNSYLDEIERLAPAAATGRFSDKISLVNSLIAPFSSEKADAVTANNLLDKYSNQIVARLGSGDGKGGGMGTDAARAILQSAYPNATMNVPAIKEAAASIRSVNAMQQAKLSFLSPQGNARDPVAYQEREQKFDTVADPRVFQLANMPADEARAFLAKQSPAVQADLKRRAAALKEMKVF